MFFVSVLFKTPRTADEWRQVALGFETRWNYPHCLGGLDGKHVRIVPPACSGSSFYNFKGFHSIVLMAQVDSSYEFVYVDVGSEGRAADGGIWNAFPFITASQMGVSNYQSQQSCQAQTSSLHSPSWQTTRSG